MNRLISFFAVILLLLAGAAIARADASRNAEQFANFGAVAFSEVKSLSVAQIVDPSGHDGTQASEGDFHGCKLLSKWNEVSTRSQDALVGLLKRPIDFWVRTYAAAGDKDIVTNSSFCMPDWGYAIRIETSDGPRDFLICLQCGQIEVFGRDHRVEFDVNEGDLIKLKAYYVDEFILKTGVKRQAQPPKN